MIRMVCMFDIAIFIFLINVSKSFFLSEYGY